MSREPTEVVEQTTQLNCFLSLPSGGNFEAAHSALLLFATAAVATVAAPKAANAKREVDVDEALVATVLKARAERAK